MKNIQNRTICENNSKPPKKRPIPNLSDNYSNVSKVKINKIFSIEYNNFNLKNKLHWALSLSRDS